MTDSPRHADPAPPVRIVPAPEHGPDGRPRSVPDADPGSDVNPRSVPDTASARRRVADVSRGIVPGAAVVAAITVVATVAGGFAPVVGGPVFAILIGIGITAVRTPTAAFAPGIRFASKRVLQGSIIVLGFGLSFSQVARSGVESLPVLVGTLVGALGVAWFVGRRLRIRRDTNVLIGVGTAICGASAIAATSAAIDAEDANVSYSIATIFLFNVLAVLTFPALGHALGLSQESFGLFAGTAINDTSSVVAAANIYGADALSYAVVVKLTRTLAIIPITIVLAWWWHRRRTSEAAGAAPDGAGDRAGDMAGGAGDRVGGATARTPLRRIFPLFIVGFVAAVAVNSTGVIPAGWHDPLAHIAAWMITAALAAIGLSTNFRQIRTAGARPILLGAILWVTVGVLSLGLQAATGLV